MDKRLELATNLLTKEGLLVASIDDNEICQFKLILDKYFNHNTKIIAVKMSEASGLKMAATKRSGTIPKLKGYLIFAKKNGVKVLNFDMLPKQDWDEEYRILLENFTKEDKKLIDEISIKDEITNHDIEVLDLIAKNIQKKSVKEKLKELKITSKEKEREWLFDNAFRIVQEVASSSVLKLAMQKKEYNSQNLFFVKSAQGLLYFAKSDFSMDSKKPRVQLIFAEDNLTQHPGDFWSDIKTTGLDNEGYISFKNGKKPLELIKRIIQSTGMSDITILDFFAGSGTTGHAALELNKIDGGNRKFILCTNNENNICEGTTYKRLSIINNPQKYNLNNEPIHYSLDYLQIKHISDLDLECADDIGNFEYVKHINNVKFNATKTITENDFVYITNTYSVFKKSKNNKQKEYCDFFEQSIKENISNIVFVSSDRTEYDYFRKIISDYISTLEENPLFEKIKYYQMSKNYMDNMLSIINGEEEIDVEKYMNDEENQENGEQQ